MSVFNGSVQCVRTPRFLFTAPGSASAASPAGLIRFDKRREVHGGLPRTAERAGLSSVIVVFAPRAEFVSLRDHPFGGDAVVSRRFSRDFTANGSQQRRRCSARLSPPSVLYRAAY